MTTRTEAQKYEAAFRKVQRQIHLHAESSLSEFGPEARKLTAAVHALGERVRWVASELGTDGEELFARNSGLFAAALFAKRQAGANLKEARWAESARIQAEIRSKRPLPEGAYRLGWL